jgi:hypothetical protein
VRRLILLAPLLASGLMAAAPAADATMTCSEPTNQAKLVVTSDSGNADSKPIIGRDPAGKITVDAFSNQPVATCGPSDLTSTVTNIATIEISGPTGAPSTLDPPIVSQFNGPLGPGSVNTPPNDEIKLIVSGWRSVDVGPPDSGGTVRAGTSGVDMNGDGDVDLTFAAGTTPDFLALHGAGGPDTLSAAGGDGTGGAIGHAVGLFGLGGNDTLIGGEGDDLLIGRMGDDVTDGRGGADRADYSDSSDNTVDLEITGPQDTGGGGTDTLRNIEDLRGGGGTDRFFGTDGPNEIVADLGSDVVDGRGGDDDLESTLPGFPPGPGDRDLLSYASAPAGITVDLRTTAPQATGGAGRDTIAGFTDLVGSSFADRLTGTDEANRIAPGGGADTIAALGGADSLRLRDAAADTGDCGGAEDTVVSDNPGTDALTGCEFADLAPAVAITGPSLTSDRTPAFGLTASESGAALQCRLDGAAAFVPCGVSFTAPALDDGVHTLTVRGVDGQGPSLEPAIRAVTVDTVAPSITRLRATRRPPRSTRLAFRLSEGGSVALRAERLAKGRKVRGHCRAATRKRRKKPRCTRVLAAGRLEPFAKPAGASTKTFRGRTIRRGKLRRLAPGRYRLILRATDEAGNVSKPARVRVRVSARRAKN